MIPFPDVPCVDLQDQRERPRPGLSRKGLGNPPRHLGLKPGQHPDGPFALPAGILLTSNALTSRSNGEAVDPSEKPSRASAG